MRTLYTKVVGTDGDTTKTYKEIAGLSTETKPTDGLATGSCFIEVDTCLVALFDEDNAEWHGGTVVDDNDGEAKNAEPVVVKTTRKKSVNNG